VAIVGVTSQGFMILIRTSESSLNSVAKASIKRLKMNFDATSKFARHGFPDKGDRTKSFAQMSERPGVVSD